MSEVTVLAPIRARTLYDLIVATLIAGGLAMGLHLAPSDEATICAVAVEETDGTPASDIVVSGPSGQTYTERNNLGHFLIPCELNGKPAAVYVESTAKLIQSTRFRLSDATQTIELQR